MKFYIVFAFIFLLLTGCMVGPDYKRPKVLVPDQYKEASKHWAANWKVAQPRDMYDRGQWWRIFKNPKLNALEAKLNCCNQSVEMAKANYQQALAVLAEARASFFPTLTGTFSITRQNQTFSGNNSNNVATVSASSNGNSTNVVSSGNNGSISTTNSLQLNASWEPDVWGAIGRTVEASQASAQAERALLASTRLSAQGTLAQTYFQLRALDKDQQILDDTVREYRQFLTLTQHSYHAGVAAESDVIQARTQLESAQALAVNNKIARAQYEHAIAILIGVPPALFSIPPNPRLMKTPFIPGDFPSSLLERRPDVAQAERLMAQANAQIGIAVSAYYPTLTIPASASYQASGYASLFSIPGIAWSIGPQLAETILDGGLRSATVAAAKANYRATIASYRQTVLTAFQNVEDNLVALNILKQQAKILNKAARDAKLALKLIVNQYKSGTATYTAVITAQVTAFNAEKAAADVEGLKMVAAAGLVKSLGGGWDGCGFYACEL